MSIAGLTSTEQTTAIKAVFAANDVRALIANHLGVSIERVTDEAHFTDDLGADWLGRLELMTVVEDQFAGVEISDADVDRIEVVGDLIRHIESVDNERRRRGAAPVIRNLFGPRLARAMKPTKQQGWEQLALFFLRLAGDPVRNLIGWCLRPDSRLIFKFTLTMRPWPASGPIWCAFSVRTAEPNMRRRSSGLPRGHSRSNLLKRNARGISTPRDGKVGEQRFGDWHSEWKAAWHSLKVLVPARL
jgi:acyl carrier protein